MQQVNNRYSFQQFKSKQGKIVVCLNRWLFPEQNSRLCKEAQSEAGEVEFTVLDPCKWKRIDKCLPIYFTVRIANASLVPLNDCLGTAIHSFVSNQILIFFVMQPDERCKKYDQIEWTMWHSGLHCAHSSFVKHEHSLQLVCLSVLLVLVVNLYSY